MTKYPPISTAIRHNPRPTTDVLEAVNTTATMFTTPNELTQTGLEPPSVTASSAESSDNDPTEYPQFLLLGDSITQFSTLTLQAYLQTQYIRRLDVVNRGLSGFTAPMAYRSMQKFVPLKGYDSHIKLLTVFFGANDACMPGQQQHVDIQEYVDTLRDIVQYPLFQQETCWTKIIVITPPPVNEHQFEKPRSGHFHRRAGITSQYAQAAREVAEACDVHVLDFWAVLMHKVGWRPSMGRECCCEHLTFRTDHESPASPKEHIPGCSHIPANHSHADYQLSDFLVDGLHLTKLGYDVLFWEMMKLIRQELPECAPENLPFVIPEWRKALQLAEYCK